MLIFDKSCEDILRDFDRKIKYSNIFYNKFHE